MKIKILICVSLAIFNSSDGHSQKGSDNYIDYYNFANEAEYYFHNEQYDSAVIYYERGFQFVNIPYPSHYYRYSKALWKLGERSKVIRAFKKGYCGNSFIHTNGEWFAGMSEKTKMKIKGAIDKRISRIEDVAFTPFIDSLMERDQALRKLIDSVKVIAHSENKEADLASAYILMELQDSTNGVRLIEFVRTHGFPGGINAGWNQRLATLLVHMNRDWYLENFALLKEEIRKGNLEPWMFAMGFDRAIAISGNVVWFNIDGHKSQYIAPDEFSAFQNCVEFGISPYYNYHWLPNPRETPNLWIYRTNKRVYNTTIY